MHATSWINGRATDLLSSADRGLQYGDGVFETITCIDGRPRWLAQHLQRLRRGCERLQLRFEAFDDLGREIAAQAAAGESRCIVKLIVTRGPALQRGYAPQGDEEPTRILTRHEWPAPAAAPGTQGFRVALSGVRLGINPLLAGLKHLNRLEQVLARNAMRGAALEEVLMLSSSGQVIGGSMSNVFFGNHTGLVTPQLRECGVEGIMRGLVCEAAGRAGVPLEVRAVEVGELAQVREAFVTNVRWGLQSITQLEGRPLPSRHWAQALQASIDAAQS
jgi:4-amino-4-deoxychorismate lyase